MSKISQIPLQCRIAHYLARTRLQPFWRGLNALSYWGLGYSNWVSSLNGEDRFAQSWAKQHRDRHLVIFDVGANEGDFTAHLLALLPDAQFHLFEPNPATFSRVERRFAGRPNVRLNPCGVGSAPGSAKLYDLGDSEGTERASLLPETFSVILHQNGANVRDVEVRVITLDDYCAELAIDHIHLLKIDTEGFERFVLEGAQGCFERGAIDAVQLEFNEQNVISGLNLYRLHKMLPDYDGYRLLVDGLAPVFTGTGGYDTRYDMPKYCNIVLLRRSPS